MNPISQFVRRWIGPVTSRQQRRRVAARPLGQWSAEQLEVREVPASFSFDFGTSTSPVMSGYTAANLTRFSETAGFGWQSTSGMSAATRATGTALSRDVHLGKDSTFLANVPNGEYDVAVTLGDPTTKRDRMSVYAEGKLLGSNVTTEAGQTNVVRGRVTVTDGQVALRVADGGGVNSQFAIAGLTLTSVTPPTNTTAQTLFSSATRPGYQEVTDTAAVELGVKFQTTSDGYITGVRFYKQAGNSGTHVGNLWTASGQKLASAVFTSETASGWQEVTFATPVAVKANTTYVASYFAPRGQYSYDNNYFTSSFSSGDLKTLSNSQGGGGVYRYSGGSAFPNQTYQSTNYYVDVTFVRAVAGSTPTPAPTASAGPDRTVNEGQALTLQGAATGTGLTYTWNFGDGTTATGTATPTKTYADNGTYTVTLTVTDASGRTVTDTAVVTATNVAPTATLTGGGTVTAGQSTTFALTNPSDPSSKDAAAGFRYSFDFNNDGDFTDAGDVSNAASASAAYTFSSAGTYTVRGRITDKDGGFKDYTTSVTVTAPTPPPTTPPTNSGGYTGILRTLYVSASGSDSNSGSSASPWRTLQKAADSARPGDMIVVRAGTYTGFELTTSGTAANPIVFKADPGVLINAKPAAVSYSKGAINLEGASYVAIDGFRVVMASYGSVNSNIRSVANTGVVIRNNVIDNAAWWGIMTGFSQNVLIENNTVTNTQIQHGIYVGNSADNPVIRGNTVTNSRGAGIQINSDVTQGGDGIISNAVVENNRLIGNARVLAASINLDGVQNAVIRNNVIYGSRNGITLYQTDGAQGAKNNLIVGNTIVFDAGVGYFAIQITGGSQGSTGNRVFNNILYRQAASGYGSIGVDAASRSGFQSDYNVVVDGFNLDPYGNQPLTLAQWRSQTGQDTHSIVATPDQLFVDWRNGDFRLKSGSPAANAGTNLPQLTTDLTGKTRPAGGVTDIGAYESF